MSTGHKYSSSVIHKPENRAGTRRTSIRIALYLRPHRQIDTEYIHAYIYENGAIKDLGTLEVRVMPQWRKFPLISTVQTSFFDG